MNYSTQASDGTYPVEMNEPAVPVRGNIEPDVTLDVSGLICPLPGVKMAKAVAKLESGQVLEVRGTNPIFKKFAPTVFKKSGHEWLGVVEDDGDGFFRFYLKKV